MAPRVRFELTAPSGDGFQDRASSPLRYLGILVRVRGLEPPEHGFLDRSLCHSGTPAYVYMGGNIVATLYITTIPIALFGIIPNQLVRLFGRTYK